jgi:polyisoprenyl-phosphate glycosyltransferase
VIINDTFVSVIMPLSGDADILEQVLVETVYILQQNYKNYEIILVDDDSSDRTRSILEKLLRVTKCLHYLKLSRKFGLEVAIACGLDRAIGDVVVILRPESDPPELIPQFVKEAHDCGGIVVGVRNVFDRRSIFYSLTYKLYYLICRLFLERPHIYCSTHYMALTRPALNALLKIQDSYRHLRVLSMYAGYGVRTLRYQRIERRKQVRHRKLLPLLDTSVSMIVSNSVKPLRLAGLLSVITALFNFTYLVSVVLTRYLLENIQYGWASISFQSALASGILFLILAVICEYLARLLEEIKIRPLYYIETELQSNIMLSDSEARNVVHKNGSTVV